MVLIFQDENQIYMKSLKLNEKLLLRKNVGHSGKGDRYICLKRTELISLTARKKVPWSAPRDSFVLESGG